MTRARQTLILVATILLVSLIFLGFMLQSSKREVFDYPECIGWFGYENQECVDVAHRERLTDDLMRAARGY